MVVTDTDGKIVVATIDDGNVNALSFALIGEIRAAVATAVERQAPLVLAGRTGQFSAGFDLTVMRSGDRDAIVALLTEGGRLFRDVLEAPVPVVAACTGHALAAGALLLLSADHRIGTRGSFKIGLNEVRIGMALPPFAVALAGARLDPRHLTAATLFAEVAAPERAAEIGYLDEVAADAVAAATALAEDLAALPHDALSTTKRRVRRPLLEELAALGM